MFLRVLTSALLAAVLVGCGGQPVSLVGRITDETGAPIPKAEVFTEPDTDVVLTNPKGFFNIRQRINETGEIEPIPPGVYRVRVRKFGFEELGLEIKVEGGPNKVEDLVMKVLTPDIEETAPDPTADPEREPDEASVPIIGN
ncbi:MAG: carboxypeptidase-like regulatory domain-containing protein [Bradymonadia bacterium]